MLLPYRKSIRGLIGLSALISLNPIVAAYMLNWELKAFVTIIAAEVFYFELSNVTALLISPFAR
jgi:hypothetical protein